jgi:hypothetical protein
MHVTFLTLACVSGDDHSSIIVPPTGTVMRPMAGGVMPAAAIMSVR